MRAEWSRAPRPAERRPSARSDHDPVIDDFRMNLESINALAEASPGFVWRLQDESGNATSIQPFDDELEIINLTVWESIEALADFTYRSGHVEFLRRRREFFEVPAQPILCLWWIPEGTIPTVEEAIARLEHLRAHGPTPTASAARSIPALRRSSRSLSLGQLARPINALQATGRVSNYLGRGGVDDDRLSRCRHVFLDDSPNRN